MRNGLKLFTFFLMGQLVGCEEYSNIIKEARLNKLKHPEQRVFDGEVEPNFPDKNNDKTLLGIDENKNGIRDDVDIWINYVGISYNHRMALRQLAKQEVKRLQAGAFEDSASYAQIAKDIWDGGLCSAYVEHGNFKCEEYPSLMIDQIIYNTSLRRKSYENFRKSTVVYKSNIENMNTKREYLACGFKVEMRSEK